MYQIHITFKTMNFYENILHEVKINKNKKGIITPSWNKVSPLFWLTCQGFVSTSVCSPWVITPFCNASVSTNKYQPVGTVVKLGLTVDTFPIPVAVSFVGNHSEFGLAGIWLTLSLPLSISYKKIQTKQFQDIRELSGVMWSVPLTEAL